MSATLHCNPAVWPRARARQTRRNEPTNHGPALVLEAAADAWERDEARAGATAKRERAQALCDAQPTLPSLPITRRRLNETPKKG
ncbi:hypothetical protein [Azospirillum sp. Marseille-Q6669]